MMWSDPSALELEESFLETVHSMKHPKHLLALLSLARSAGWEDRPGTQGSFYAWFTEWLPRRINTVLYALRAHAPFTDGIIPTARSERVQECRAFLAPHLEPLLVAALQCLGAAGPLRHAALLKPARKMFMYGPRLASPKLRKVSAEELAEGRPVPALPRRWGIVHTLGTGILSETGYKAVRAAPPGLWAHLPESETQGRAVVLEADGRHVHITSMTSPWAVVKTCRLRSMGDSKRTGIAWFTAHAVARARVALVWGGGRSELGGTAWTAIALLDTESLEILEDPDVELEDVDATLSAHLCDGMWHGSWAAHGNVLTLVDEPGKSRIIYDDMVVHTDRRSRALAVWGVPTAYVTLHADGTLQAFDHKRAELWSRPPQLPEGVYVGDILSLVPVW